MKTIRRKLIKLSLLLILAGGTLTVLPGCRDDNVGNKLDRAANNLGNAAEKAGDEAKNTL